MNHWSAKNIDREGGPNPQAIGGLSSGDLTHMHFAASSEAVGGKGHHYIPARQNMRKVALFIGTDISAHVIANKLIPMLRRDNIRAKLYLPTHRTSSKPEAQLPANKELAFVERGLTQSLYEFLSDKPLQNNGSYVSPKQMATAFGIEVEEVENVNDPAFMQKFDEEEFEASLSIRCYQKFSQDFIDIANKKGVLWNMHPGYLRSRHKEEEFRGIVTNLRVMNEGLPHAGWTLHVIDKDFDTGPIVDRTKVEIDYKKPMMDITLDSAGQVASMASERLNDFLEDGEINLKAQKPKELRGPLFSHPNQQELDRFMSKGFRMCDIEAHIKRQVSDFIDLSTRDGKNLGINAIYHQVQTANNWLNEQGIAKQVFVENCIPNELQAFYYERQGNNNGPHHDPNSPS